jgi:hypothetical protein
MFLFANKVLILENSDSIQPPSSFQSRSHDSKRHFDIIHDFPVMLLVVPFFESDAAGVVEVREGRRQVLRLI